MKPTLCLIVPCYNEEQIIEESHSVLWDTITLLNKANKISKSSFIAYVDDGSSDGTWQKIQNFVTLQNCKGIKLSRNFGHQNALMAGLSSMIDNYDIAITIDADLQDDISVISQMVDKHALGAKVVYGIRQDRSSDSIFKRMTAQWFYKFMKSIKAEIIYNHADFRLLDQQVVKHLLQFKERELFLRGIIPLIGFQFESVYYSRKKRIKGDSKYPLTKMIALAINGITSLSSFPLRIVLYLGVLIFVLSFFLIMWVILSYVFKDTVPGWSSLIIPLCFFSGIQMISIGILGEYLSKVYNESKSRPRFIIEQIENNGKEL